jgi:hypothetical protein
VYAGAAREAVFSNPAVIRRINAGFVPLALRAPSVNQPDSVPDKDERWLYQRISRVKLAPQGICVLNSAGQVLAWVQMFDDDRSVLDFLDHGLKCFRANADAKRLVATERYMSFPSARHKDFRDEVKPPAVVAEGHPPGKSCPAHAGKEPVPAGSVLARLVGRALDDKGKLLADTVRQEHYVEDQFSVKPAMQRALAKVLGSAGAGPVRLPDDFARLCAAHAHLGHIDVQPCLCMIKGRAENKGEWKRCGFRARKVKATGGTTLWRVEGQSEVVSEVAINGNGVHNVKLTWEGFIRMKGDRMVHLLLAARGREKLQFAKDDHPLKKTKRDEVALLPAGRPIDQEGGVRYGIVGEPVAAGGADTPGTPKGDDQEIPEQARRQLVQMLGPVFLVFRDKVQEELRLSDKQKVRLNKRLQKLVPKAMQFFATLGDKKPEQREKETQSYRQKVGDKLATFLKGSLTDAQRKRLRQLELQQEGAFALGRPDIGKELKITQEQQKQFTVVVRGLQQQIAPLIKEAQSGGNPQEILPRIMKVRKEHEGKIEALLSDAQKKQWKELLGKPLDLDD